MRNKMYDKLVKIIDHYGVMKQLKYMHTEYCELDEAVVEAETFDMSKYTLMDACDKYTKKVDHIGEEIADVMVMLKQIQYHYDISDDDLDAIMNAKIERQLERIANEKGND